MQACRYCHEFLINLQVLSCPIIKSASVWRLSCRLYSPLCILLASPHWCRLFLSNPQFIACSEQNRDDRKVLSIKIYSYAGLKQALFISASCHDMIMIFENFLKGALQWFSIVLPQSLGTMAKIKAAETEIFWLTLSLLQATKTLHPTLFPQCNLIVSFIRFSLPTVSPVYNAGSL